MTRVSTGNGYFVEIEQTPTGYDTSVYRYVSMHNKPALVPYYNAESNRYESHSFGNVKEVFQYLAEIMQRTPVKMPERGIHDSIPSTQYAWQNGAGIAVREQLSINHSTARRTGIFWSQKLAAAAPCVTA